ncbi:MAG: hypothetical protein E7617_01325 [Ruminococcaceae bacterium]|nr:hypothetical protein [Oscillospiraceae bacterium]
MKKRQRLEARHSAPTAIILRCIIYLVLFPAVCLAATAMRYGSTSPTALLPVISLASLLVTGFVGSIIRFGALKDSTTGESLTSILMIAALYTVISAVISGAVSAKIAMNALCFVLVSLATCVLSRSVFKRSKHRRHKPKVH